MELTLSFNSESESTEFSVQLEEIVYVGATKNGEIERTDVPSVMLCSVLWVKKSLLCSLDACLTEVQSDVCKIQGKSKKLRETMKFI